MRVQLSIDVRPDPAYPKLHVQAKEPVVSEHAAFGSQSFPGASPAHSFTLVHVRPSPVQPGSHAHVNDPLVSVHVA